MLVAAETTLSAHNSMLLMLVSRLMSMGVILETLVHAHLEVLVPRTTVKQAMILPVSSLVVHAV